MRQIFYISVPTFVKPNGYDRTDFDIIERSNRQKILRMSQLKNLSNIINSFYENVH